MNLRTPLALLTALLLALAPVALAQDEAERGANETDAKDRERDAGEDAGDEKDDARADGKDARDEDDEGDDRDREDADEVERKVVLELSDKTALVKLEREAGDVEDEIKIALDGEDASMKVEYKSENATSEAETELKVKFREIVEFVDNDSDGAFDPSEEEVVQRTSHEHIDWVLAQPEDATSASGEAGKKLRVTGTLPDGTGNVSFVLYVYGDFAVVNGTSLKPSEVKIDILVQDYPYQRNDSQVALLFKTEQEAKLESDDEGDASGLLAHGGNFTAYFTWADVALVDGVNLPVHATVVEDERASDDEETKAEQRVWFAYPRGADVNHDPVLGVSASEPDGGAPSGSPGTDATTTDGAGTQDNATPGPGALVALAAVGFVALALRRRGA